MKHQTILLLLFLHLSTGITRAGSLTLEEARRITLENNPRIEEMARRVTAARAVLSQARSAWYPQLKADGGYNQLYVSQQPEFDPSIRVQENFTQTTASLEASWLLFDGFAREARILAAKAGTNAAQQVYRNMQRLMLQSVTVAFYQAQLAQEDMLIARQDRDFNRALESDAQTRWKTGSAPEADKLTFEVRALQAESAWLYAQSDLDTAAIVLAELMGLEGAKLPDNMMPVRNDQPLAEMRHPDPESEIRYALAERPDLIALRAQQDALHQQLREQRGNWYPTVALTAGTDYTHRDEITPVQNNRSQFAGVVASWDLFTGGRRPARIREIKAEEQALQAQQIQKELEIQAAIRRAINTAQTAYEIGARQEKAWQLSQRIRDFIEKAYKAGAETQTRLNEAQTDLTRSAGAAARARIAYLLALANLDAETGRLLSE